MTEPNRPFVVTVDWDSTPHLDDAAKSALIQSYAPHEREARTRGKPALGAGAIYPVPLDDVLIDPIDVPAHWPRGYGMDVGWNMTAAVWGAHDRETDVVYLYSEHYRAHSEPSIHAAAIRARGVWMHGVIDPASRGRGQKDGEQLFANYVELGLNLSVAENGVEAGLFDVWQRLSTGRLRVFRTLASWIREYTFYQRDENGKVRKKDDHLMDATRYLCVSGVGNFQLDPQYLDKMGHRPRVVSDYDPISDSAFAA